MASFSWLEPALGTPSKVRILRVLCWRPDAWFSEADLSRAIRMSPNTVNLALRDIGRVGLLESQVGGRGHSVRLRASSPMASAIRRLYQTENDAVEDIRRAIRPLVPDGSACILFGSAARGDMGPKSDIDVLFIAPTRDAAATLDVLATRAAYGVFPGRYRSIYLTPTMLRKRWNQPLVESIRRDGVLLGGSPLEAFR